ncbi:hypothetical protein [Bradyrhizobium sp. STM 3561]|uniref:hypothetical protein n=1 Tax=Bradyrhizobium sp. STM 3561 TaxID=578923 RepID=UPI00388E0930
MDGGIAMSFANTCIPVILIETGEEQLRRASCRRTGIQPAKRGIPADAPPSAWR